MNVITKVSEITASDVAEYLHLEEVGETDTNTLNNLILIAKKFIMQYTGRTEEEMEDISDFIIVVFVLVQDMWDNRALYVDKSNLNRVVETVLGMHAVNLL